MTSTWVDAGEDLERHTAHEFVRERLRRAILRGDLSGGERLIQADLAEMLHVSTTPVREALRDLATEGLITLDRHRGGVVRELNWDDMDEIGQIRRQLEPLAMRLVIERIDEAQIREAERLLQRMSKERDVGDWVELNRAFHLVFHEATGNARLTAIMKGLEESVAVYVAQAQRTHPEMRRLADAGHAALVEAVRARDIDRAVQVMVEHVGMPIEMTEHAERPVR
ncbi:MAG TPA: GntR family transcriptional regulator [Actinomycetota bacterium]|nr:GntR family transcriptional regulator [Actinomycetota bacterium]